MNTSQLMHQLGLQELDVKFEEAMIRNQCLRELKRQFESLITYVEDWMNRSPAKSESNPADAERIHLLLESFKEFFTDYYLYFVRRIVDNDFKQRSQQEVLRTVIDQILEPGATLSRLLGQRRHGSLHLDWLIEADKRADRYYSRYYGAKTGGDKPVVYFEKLYRITRFPFRPPPLIAIPLADWNRPEAWLPLAHELGHHVYWNSADLDAYRHVQETFRGVVEERSKAFFEANPQYAKIAEKAKSHWLTWVEESFADVFGTLIAGPAYAIEAQERLVRNTLSRAEDLLWDDAQHPLPAIRPLIASETLKYMEDGQAIAEKLEKRWQPYLDQAEAAFENVQAHRSKGADIDQEVSPKVIAAMTPYIIKGLLTQPVLQAGPGSLEQKPLFDLVVKPWQPDPVLKELSMAQFAAEGLNELPLPLAPVDHSRQNLNPPPEPPETYLSESFRQLRSYVQQEIQEGRVQKSEWEVLLALDLAPTLDLDHSWWLYHEHELWHKHGDLGVICDGCD